MSDFLERFEQQLLAAKPPRQRPWKRSVAVFAAGVILLTAPALAATRPWEPKIGDEKRGAPQVSVDRPPAEQLTGLSVLRRAQTAADRAGVAVRALELTDRNVDGVRTDWVRVLSAQGIDAALVPVRRYDLRLSRHIEPEMSEEMKRVLSIKRDGLCLFVPDPSGDGGGYGCVQWDDVARGTLPNSIGPVLYGLVPDGVAEVEIRFNDHAPLRLTVRDNFYAARSSEDGRVPRSADVVWLDREGEVLKTITPPHPSTEPAATPARNGRGDR